MVTLEQMNHNTMGWRNPRKHQPELKKVKCEDSDSFIVTTQSTATFKAFPDSIIIILYNTS